MSDIEHGRNTTATANKSFLSSLSDELIAAQEAAKKHHNPPQHQLSKSPPRTTVSRETKVADNTVGHSAKSSYQPRSLMPTRPQKTVLPALKTIAKPAATQRSIVESAPLALRAVPTQVEPRAVNYSKALHQSEPDTLGAKSYRTERSSTAEDSSRHSNLQDTAAVPKDAVLSYARIALPPVSLPATLHSLRPLPPLQLSQEQSLSVSPAASAPMQTVTDSARYTTARTGEQSLIAQNVTSTTDNAALRIPSTRTDMLRVSEMPQPAQTSQIPQTIRLSQPQSLQTMPQAAPTFRPQDMSVAVQAHNETGTLSLKTQDIRHSDNYINRPGIAGTSFAADPNRINVRINVKSFTAADAQVKSVLPNFAPPLHPTSLPPDTPDRMPAPGEPRNNDDNGTPPSSNVHRFRTDSSTAGDKRYTLGTEIALATLIAAAGTSRRRTGTESVYEESQAITNSPYLESTGSLLKGTPIKMQVVPARLRPTMLIGRQDNLIAIAEKNFDDANLGWLIADLNRAVSNQVELNGKYLVEFESRQEIVLPVWDDTVEFYEANKDRLDNTKLITIIKQSAVDQELLEVSLGRLLNQY